MRRAGLLALMAMVAVPAAAGADGGPVASIQGGSGVSAPGRSGALIATPVGRQTLVQSVRGDTVLRYRVVRGTYGVPAVAYDGSATGLSADGSTLILAAIPERIDRTRLLPLDAHTLRPRPAIALRGFFTVDAISPDGAMLYLVHYTAPRTDSNRYEVRAYDLRSRTLLPEPIVDPREPDEKMTGVPLTRLMSPDGRWAYTLYSSEQPFVHALDTQAGIAMCVDLAALAGRDIFSATLRLDGSTLHVGDLAAIDTKTFAVTLPEPADAAVSVAADPRPAAAPAVVATSPDGAGRPLAIAVLATLAAGAVAGLVVLVRRRGWPAHHRRSRPGPPPSAA
ncbi:MAG: hypothetical protein QOE98_123 [Gaiellaceae bacterium]|nr:hypothetical protein [Gaiellaceae bacterium]